MSAITFPAHLPAPTTLPGVGRTLNALRFARDSVGYAHQLFSTYGPMVSLAAGGGTNLYAPHPSPGTVLVCGAPLVRQVTTQHEVFYKAPLSGRLYRRKDDSSRTDPLKHFGVGLFGVNSTQHRQQRQLMMPAFHHKRIESYREDMVAIAQSVIEQMPIGQVCDVAAWMRLLTLRIATKTLLGYDVNAEGDRVGQLLQDTLNSLGNPGVALLPFDLPGLPFRRLLNRMAQIDDEMRALIARKRATGGTDPDVLSMLIAAREAESGEPLSEDELLGHTGVLFAAGHETSANALTWTLFLLSQHPDIAAALHDELTGALRGDPPTVEQLQQLPLLDRVVKESLRILPPVPWNGRVTSQPTELGGYPLPAGTEVFVSIYETHHQSEPYPEPERFLPQRWEHIHPSPYEYNPFSAGSRICIGAAFAMMEIKIVLAMLLQRDRLEFLPQHRLHRQGLIVMAPRGGMPMRVHPQDREFNQGVGGVRGNVREMVQLPE